MPQLTSAFVEWEPQFGAPTKIVLYATGPVSAGRLMPKDSEFRFMGFADSDEGLIVFQDTWNDTYGTCQANQVFFTRLDSITSTGFRQTIMRRRVVIF